MAAPAFAQTAPAVIDLATLDGSNGFAIAGPAPDAALGTAVSGAGDVNHDGLADIIVGAPAARSEGVSYVIFGSPVLGGSGAFDLAALDGSNGFEFQSRSRPEEGATIYTDFGVAVAGVGDVNADGLDDVAAAALTSDVGDGATWVVFGSDEVFPALVLTWELEGIDGTDGFVSRPGFPDMVSSVSGAGDVNGDGVDDFIVGTPRKQVGPFGSGEADVLFGNPDIAATVNGRPLLGTNGFTIPGLAEGDRTGTAVGGGDINGDGRSDVVVSAPGAPGGESDGAGETYVVFGASAIGMSGSFDVATLDGTNGFLLHGARVSSVAVGDVNGDEFADVVLGEPEVDFNGVVFSGAVYVVFGSNNAFPATFDLASLDGSNGYVIAGASANDFAGTSVDVASDVNGDDVDDIVIGAPQHFPPEEEQPGAAYVVFGGAGVGGGGVVELATLDGTNGFALEGATALDRAGESVSGAGDVNGDGLGDIIVGAPGADSNGLGSGTSYVVFGRAAATPATCRVTASPNILWPPNRQLIRIQTTVTVQDDANIPFSYELVAVTSNEPTPNSIVGWELGTADTDGFLRAQRNAGGDGRVYTLSYRVFGTLGTIASCEANVRVPHDMRPPRDDRPTGPIRPSLPRLPDLPSLPGRPTPPRLPNLPDLPDLPDLPER